MRTARAVRTAAMSDDAPGASFRSVYAAPDVRVHAIAWWQYERDAKRCYALELPTRSLFSKVPYLRREANGCFRHAQRSVVITSAEFS
jgi:hypothetical protein